MSTFGQILRRLHLYEMVYRALRELPANRRRRLVRKRFYSQFVRPGDLVFDIGANMGNRIEAFVALGASVIAVEPQGSCVASLRRLYRNQPDVVVVAAGAGAEPGEATLRLAESHTLASMSDEFIDKTRQAGRFAEFHWNATETVPITTLDRLITDHGIPTFCKIDVEGFELQVLAGLSQPLPAVSFEFTAELDDQSAACIDRFMSLGHYVFNASLGESFEWALPEWTDGVTIKAWLREVGPGGQGDVYARSWVAA
jgi:FkbM family methyltransferase